MSSETSRPTTMPNPDDHAEILETLQRDGFVACRQFLSEQQLAELDEQLSRFLNDVLPSVPRDQVFYEDRNAPSTLKQIQHMDQHDPWFAELLRAGRMRETAEVMLRGGVVPKNLQFFNKPAQVGRATPPHQDGYYFMLDPCEAITMWLALDSVDQQNGCVRYVAGSHLRGMRRHHRTSTLGFSQGISDYPNEFERSNEQAVLAAPGDLLIHSALTVHRADANGSSNRSRRALGFIYFSERAKEDSQAQAAYQQRLADELMAEGKL